MLYYNNVDVSEGIDIYSNKSKECVICYYWYFKDIGKKYEPYVCNECHGILMILYELENIAILDAKGIDYRYALWNMARNNATNSLNNSELDDKGSF